MSEADQNRPVRYPQIDVTAKWKNADVFAAFRDVFASPAGFEGFTQSHWKLDVVPTDCDGILAMRLVIDADHSIDLLISAGEASSLADELTFMAKIEESHLD